MAKPTDLVQGTLDLLILKTISLEPMHGWAIAKRIQQVSREALLVQQGSLYPALHRLERQRLIRADWDLSGNGQRVRTYQLTPKGKVRLRTERSRWEELSRAMGAILRKPAEDTA